MKKTAARQKSYFRHQIDAIKGIALGLESIAQGDGLEVKNAFERIRRKHRIPISK